MGRFRDLVDKFTSWDLFFELVAIAVLLIAGLIAALFT